MNSAKSPVKNRSTPGGSSTATSSGKSQPAMRAGALARSTPAKNSFPIVGIGASAGGLEAFSKLLEHLPRNSGMAYVLVQHLAPKHSSALTQLLSRTTKLPVSEVEDGMPVEPDHVYVIPPNSNMVIMNGVLHLTPRGPAVLHLPIDYFLSSLAEDQGSKAIGVILSGTASDGTQGMKAIKAAGGITFAQDEQSAKYADMPRNTIASGSVDFILPPDAIARELIRIARHPYLRQPQTLEAADGGEGEDALTKIFALLRNATGVDFRSYKPTTIKRRIERRMVLRQIETLRAYLKYLHEHRSELDALYQDILIHVTGFFRDPEVFEALKKTVFPSLIKERDAGAPIRIWVPGCSTGEEAYSIAICLLEYLAENNTSADIQIFATDISETALEKARAGFYPETIAADVSQERLRRFFVQTASGYHINKAIRDMSVFARQDVVQDPPFSRLDLISCRNLLIYLGPALQKKVVPTFHYALKPAGFLVLGSAETIGTFEDHFFMVDKKHKIYAKKGESARLPAEDSYTYFPKGKPAVGKKTEEAGGSFDVRKQADRILLSRYAPASVLTNANMEILQFRGRTGLFLEPAPGQASLNLLKMAREGLLADLRDAIQKAKKQDLPVKKQRVQIDQNGRTTRTDIEVVPIKGVSKEERYFLVLFQEPAPPVGARRHLAPTGKRQGASQRAEQREVARLKNELRQLNSTLQSVIEEQEATSEELRAANEEVLSANEELQSTNEELETSKEELQSTNEELTTLNEELHNRNAELNVANSDFVNLLSSSNLPIVMLGSDLRIRRFTPQGEKLLNLIPADLGRPITDIRPNFDIPEFAELLQDVIDSGAPKECEVQDRQGRWFSMRVRPYKTTQNRIDGAIVTWVDINALKVSLEQYARYAQAIVETARDSLLVLDVRLRIKMANATFYQTFQVLPQETENRLIYELGNGQWEIPRLRLLLEEILPKESTLEDFEVEHDFPRIGHRKMLLNARQIHLNPASSLILLAIEDVTAREQTEDARHASDERYRMLFNRNLAGVYRATADGRILECNDALGRILGYDSQAELAQRTAWELFSSRPEWEAFVARMRDANAPVTSEFSMQRKDGRPAWVLMNAILEPDGIIEGIFLDITGRKESEETQSHLSARLMELQDKERRRVSRELHDTTGSSLTALVASLARAKKSRGLSAEAREAMNEGLELAKQCTREIRTVTYLLHPPLLDELGLASALRWYTEGFGKRSGVRVTLEIPPDLGRLPEDAEIALFRIVQEALTNVHLHSQSATAQIRVARESNKVLLEVADQGPGGKVSKRSESRKKPARPGVGIAGMRERVKQLGGEMEINSTSKGTTVKVTLPLDCQPPEKQAGAADERR